MITVEPRELSGIGEGISLPFGISKLFLSSSVVVGGGVVVTRERTASLLPSLARLRTATMRDGDAADGGSDGESGGAISKTQCRVVVSKMGRRGGVTQRKVSQDTRGCFL